MKASELISDLQLLIEAAGHDLDVKIRIGEEYPLVHSVWWEGKGEDECLVIDP